MADFPSIPFEEAVDALRRRGINLFPSDHWAEVWQNQHQAGFTVARSAGFDILKDIHAELMKAMENGTTFTEFKSSLVPILQKKGWWGKTNVTDSGTGEVKTVQLGSLRRLRTIFDVNMRVSLAQGRWEQQQAVKKDFPYLRYEGVLDSRIRPLHKTWHGTILPMDHPWWDTHYPPNGWKCRCDAVAVSDDDLERNGWHVTEAPAEGVPVTWLNPATGEVLKVPAGIDPGWAYNPGNTDQAARMAKLAMDKLLGMPPRMGAAATAKLAFAFPQVEKELAEWIASIMARIAAKDFKATGARHVVGALGDDALNFLEKRNIILDTVAITTGDEDLIHAKRPKKERQLPASIWERLPSLLAKPEAIYWDLQKPGFVYTLNEPECKGKIIVLINYSVKIKRKPTIANNVRTGEEISSFEEFKNVGRYVRIK